MCHTILTFVMEFETKVVDLTLSDDESCSACELLPLHERLLVKKNENKLKECSDEVCASLQFGKNNYICSKKFEAEKVISSDVESNDELPDVSNLGVFKTAESVPDREKISARKLDIDVPKPAKKPCNRKKVDEEKEIAKMEKVKLREEKKQEKELAKALKASEKEIQKCAKPDECLKNMKVVIDQSIIFISESEDIFSALDEANIKYNVEENSVHQSVIWCRTVVDVSVNNNQVVKTEKEELENTLILVIPCEDFVRMVHAFNQKSKGKFDGELSLSEYISNIQTIYPCMNITCVIIGIEKYMRSVKDNADSSDQLKKIVKQTSKNVIDEATIAVQIQAFVNFNFLNAMKDLGGLIARFTKAIAEAPQRKEKFAQKCLAFSWYADADSSCPVKLGKDGSGILELWRQQIQQFNNVGPEVSEAIVARYPSLQLLLQAYKECSSSSEAEKLLQDIVVRRNYGPLGTQRRIGPELSFKIYTFFMSRDGNQVLQR